MHGTLMVFFVLTNVPSLARHYFLPIQIGAETWPSPFQYDGVLDPFVAFLVLMPHFRGDGRARG